MIERTPTGNYNQQTGEITRTRKQQALAFKALQASYDKRPTGQPDSPELRAKWGRPEGPEPQETVEVPEMIGPPPEAPRTPGPPKWEPVPPEQYQIPPMPR